MLLSRRRGPGRGRHADRRAEVERDAAVAQAEQTARLVQQAADSTQAAADAAQAEPETDRVHADAERMLAEFGADAARDRGEPRAYRDELASLRAGPAMTPKPSLSVGHPAAAPPSGNRT